MRSAILQTIFIMALIQMSLWFLSTVIMRTQKERDMLIEAQQDLQKRSNLILRDEKHIPDKNVTSMSANKENKQQSSIPKYLEDQKMASASTESNTQQRSTIKKKVDQKISSASTESNTQQSSTSEKQDDEKISSTSTKSNTQKSSSVSTESNEQQSSTTKNQDDQKISTSSTITEGNAHKILTTKKPSDQKISPISSTSNEDNTEIDMSNKSTSPLIGEKIPNSMTSDQHELNENFELTKNNQKNERITLEKEDNIEDNLFKLNTSLTITNSNDTGGIVTVNNLSTKPPKNILEEEHLSTPKEKESKTFNIPDFLKSNNNLINSSAVYHTSVNYPIKKPLVVVLLSSLPRSGSSVMGRLLESMNDNSVYFFEPLFWVRKTPCLTNSTCIGQSLYKHYSCQGLKQKICHNTKLRVIKLVRGSLQDVSIILSDPSYNVKLIHLIRDPRGAARSIKKAGWYKNATVLCREVLKDMDTFNILIKKFPGRVINIAYERFCISTQEKTEELYNFLYGNKDLINSTKVFMKEYLHTEGKGGRNIHRDSESHYQAWRHGMKESLLNEIEREPMCQEIIHRMGYALFGSKKQLIDETYPLIIK